MMILPKWEVLKMGKFKFDGNWEIKIVLDKFYSTNRISDEENRRDETNLTICDKYGDLDPDPTKQQINAIDYLLSEQNQIEIIYSIINYLNEEIYPHYQKNVLPKEDYPNSYPDVKTLADFQNYFRLISIEIGFNSKDDFAYYSLIFDINLLDTEHGLSLDMHKKRCVDHGPGEGTDNQKIIEELKLPSNLADKLNSLMSNEAAVIYKAHPKYNKLKPWQKYANSRFPFNAYKKNEDDLIIKSIEEGLCEISQFKWIYQYAKRDNRIKLIKYFEQFEYFRTKKDNT